MSEFGAGRVTIQIFFSPYHLHAARLFRDRVRVAELESGFSLAHRSDVLGCVMSAACFLEALVNEAFEGAASGFAGIVASLPERSRSRLADAWEFLNKPTTSSLERFEWFLRRCDVRVDKGAEPWQSAHLLFDLRNAVVHARPVDTGSNLSAVAVRLEREFRSRLSEGPERPYRLNAQFSGSANPFFPDRLLGHGCCAWSVNSAEAFANWFAEKAALARWWEPPA